MEQMQRNNVGHKNKINMFRCFLRTNTELYVFDNISLTKILGIMEQRERTDAGITVEQRERTDAGITEELFSV